MYLTRTLTEITKKTLGLKVTWKISSLYHQATNKSLVLNLHRVSDLSGSMWKPCPIDVFNEFIIEVSNYFEISSFVDQFRETRKPKLILSFDDGYLDFYENVVPILEDYSLSCNHNLIPNCLITGRPPLNVVIQDIAGVAPLSVLTSIDWGLKLTTGQNPRAELSMYSQRVKKLSKFDQESLGNLIYPQITQYYDLLSTKMMSVEQAKSLPKFVHIGNHSLEHVNANAMSFKEWKSDLTLSQSWLETHFNLVQRIYAFPNGEYSQEHIDFLHKENFDVILLVGNSSSSAESKVKSRVNFTPQDIKEGRFDSIRPILRYL